MLLILGMLRDLGGRLTVRVMRLGQKLLADPALHHW